MASKISQYKDLIPYNNLSFGLVVVNLLTIAAVFLLKNSMPPVVPLFYGKPYGTEQLAQQHFLALPPILAIVVCAINASISKILKDEFLRKVLLGGMVAATLFSLITVLKIIFLVGNI